MRRWLKSPCGVVTRFERQRAGKAAVRKKTCGRHGTAQRPGGHRRKSIALILPARASSHSRGCILRGRRCGKSKTRAVGAVAAEVRAVRTGLSAAAARGPLSAAKAADVQDSSIARWRALMAGEKPKLPSPGSFTSVTDGRSVTPSPERAMLLFKFCAVCGAPFVPVRRDARFCGNACRQREYRRRKAARRAAIDLAAVLIG
jgi:predicted nucleic acid-binding Zn ribbon protein